MCGNQAFYVCKKCGNLVGMIEDKGVPMSCCGEKMAELVPNTVDAAKEKHIPVIEIKGNQVTVTVSSVLHPMLPEHHIAWIYLQTEKGGQRKCLDVKGDPKAVFALTDDDKVVAAFEYCNLHGLWKAEA